MIITLDNLQRGFDIHHKMWPDDVDVRNTIYYDIYNAREQGVTEVWWNMTVERLNKWKAIRQRTKGCTKEWIKKQGIRQLDEISQLYQQLLVGAEEPCIINSQWSDIYRLFDIALAIKETRSPVFASKLCHFIFPKLFIVIDNKATGISHYELFWRGLKNAWNEFEQKEKAKRILLNNIGNRMMHPYYPIETTIMEMCTIGYNNR